MERLIEQQEEQQEMESSAARVAMRSPHADNPGGSVTSIEARRFDRFVSTLETVLADPDTAERLSRAGVVARLDLIDLPGRAITLLFDRTPAAMTTRPQEKRADVTLAITCADLEGVFTSGDHLPLRILSGAVAFEGHVRKLLRVLPILRSAASERDVAHDD